MLIKTLQPKRSNVAHSQKKRYNESKIQCVKAKCYWQMTNSFSFAVSFGALYGFCSFYAVVVLYNRFSMQFQLDGVIFINKFKLEHVIQLWLL